jgi:hypothetical protein
LLPGLLPARLLLEGLEDLWGGAITSPRPGFLRLALAESDTHQSPTGSITFSSSDSWKRGARSYDRELALEGDVRSTAQSGW